MSYLHSPLWYPCTQMQQLEQLPPIKIIKAQGALLHTQNSQTLIDAISSWWVNLHGHNHPVLNAALHAQIEQFSHIMLAGLTHEPIEQLAHELVNILPMGLDHVFFADSGSAAIEIALKMSLHYWHQQGQPERQTFISLENGYHGETLGSLSVTDIPLFSRQYKPLLIQHLRTSVPDTGSIPNGLNEDQYVQQCLQQLEQTVQKHQNQLCGIIVEPLIQGAAGMRMYPASFLNGLQKLKAQYNFHLIFDEIAVGFGRTGTLFAFEQTNCLPDFLCLSKGITGGYLPMSAVVTSNTVYEAFYRPTLQEGFLHSHSYSGNALASSVALASLKLLQSEKTQSQIRQISTTLKNELQLLKEQLPFLQNVRSKGVVGAFELPVQFDRLWFAQAAAQKGVWLRPIGQTVYCMLPYCISEQQIQQVVNIMREIAQLAVLKFSKNLGSKSQDTRLA